MKFIQHHSGSSGNLYEVVADNGKRLIIDPGVPFAKLQEAFDYDMSNIVGCLISHEHKDHCKAVKEIVRAGIDILSSTETLEGLGIIGQRRARQLAPNTGLMIKDDFLIWPFEVHHDVYIFGYVVKCDDQHLLFATDTSHLTEKFSIPFDIIAIECSYCARLLAKKVESGEIDESLATRLLTSHMSVQQTKHYLSNCCDLSKAPDIHLLHMSGSNIVKEKAKREIESEFLCETFIVGD